MKGRSAFGVRRSAFGRSGVRAFGRSGVRAFGRSGVRAFGVRRSAFGGAMFSVLTRFEIGESLPGPDLL
jgi:hypothetical protein